MARSIPSFAFLRENAPFLSAGVTLAFTSSYGQTFFIALFAAQIMAAFSLSDGQWGLLYALATTTSAAVMVFVGPVTDRLRIRHLAALSGLALAGACLLMAGAWHWAVLGLSVFALRFAGQGMMSHLAALAMARWFVAARGRALSISAMGFALGQAVLPILFVAGMALVDWRVLWVIAAGLVLATIPLVTRLLRAERTPQSLAQETAVAGMGGHHWTRADMLRHPLFWMLTPLLLGPPMFGTALFFHQVHLVAEKGWTLAGYVALLPAFTAVSVATTLTSGAVLDRIGAGRMMQVYMLPYALAFLLMGNTETLAGAAVALLIFGMGTGLQATVPTAFWAEFYGTRHLGGIKALSTAIMVLGSAIGPGITGVAIDLGIDFPSQMGVIAAFFLGAGALAALAVETARRAA
ncbi:MFS transporter [Jannaschia seohaensis]|uniref:MFS transporter n=1 Tax=Jannaschia seohaensis TaxID=475081 RepID=A0A2Y9A0N7_9RHOB|nr:MFS transporter [Jannaschia seohaensis]PWJ21732.1 MFS transporter [Jannaschia seohaensis]SSA38010.1 Major Facilitator Superfamily protein [Jannaschia seohaensis]